MLPYIAVVGNRKSLAKRRLTMSKLACVVLFITALTVVQSAVAATYEVGPGKPYTSIGAVPWATLQPGDTVRVHWRSTPYREKWVIGRRGTASAPITVRGVADPVSGARPVIHGNGAVTAPGLNYWNEERGIIKIGGASVPASTTPQYIVVENLEVKSTRAVYQFMNKNGVLRSYLSNAAPIYLEKGENITIRNNVLHDGGNGLFIASTDTQLSRNILVEGNYFHGNGNEGSSREHNIYTAAINLTFQYNRLGPLRPGASGNNLKDRSAGLVVRYNWIEGGNRQLDLVDAAESALIRAEPSYRSTYVYGNILIEPAGAGNRQITHYGGDSSNIGTYRKGTLYFYNNTVVSYRTDRTTLFRLTTNDERCDARNNVFYAAVAVGNTVSMLDINGILNFQDNWIEPGWVVSFGSFQGTFSDGGGNVQTASPRFVNEAATDFRLAAGSPAIDAGTALHPSVLPVHNVVRQYVKHQSSRARPADGAFDIGAYEQD